MSDAIEAIAIGFSVAVVFCVPFGFAAFMRYLKYKETIALAERGLLRESRKRRNRDTLTWGILIAFMGLGLTLGILIFTEGSGIATVLGFVPACFGLALIIIYYVNKGEDKEEAERDDDPDPIPPHKVP